jgi:hypothetical protein
MVVYYSDYHYQNDNITPSLHVHPAFASNHRTNYTTTSRKGKPPLQYPVDRSSIKKMVAFPSGSGILQSMIYKKPYTRAELVTLIIEHNINRGILDPEAFMDQIFLMIQHDSMDALQSTFQELVDGSN